MLPVEVVMVVTPVPVVLPEGKITERPEAMQGELKLTVTALAVYSVPVWSTIETCNALVPPAAREPVTDNPMALDTKAVPVPLPIE